MTNHSIQYSCPEKPMDSMKRQKDMTTEDEPHRPEGIQYVTGEEQRAITNSSRKNEADGPKQKRCLFVDVSGGFDPQVGKIPWRRKWQPTQYSCLENSMDGGAW